MPKEGDRPKACCPEMGTAREDEAFTIEWRVDEYDCLKDSGSFTGFSMVLTHYGYYVGEVDNYYAPVKFCPFCGSELQGSER